VLAVCEFDARDDTVRTRSALIRGDATRLRCPRSARHAAPSGSPRWWPTLSAAPAAARCAPVTPA